MTTAIFDHPAFGALYGDPELGAHLSPEAELHAMIRFEIALARAEARHGVIPPEAAPAIGAALSGITVAPGDLAEGTLAAGVPVPALVARLRRIVGAPHGSFVHWGATSQDVIDCGLVIRLVPMLDLLEARLHTLCQTLMAEAERHARLPMAGRTRSQIATPTTLGLRIAGWAAPLIRCLERLGQMRPRVLVVQLGGASGNLSILGGAAPDVSDALADDLGLARSAKPRGAERDGMVELAAWLAMLSGLLARLGADLILMGRSEIAELAAGTGGGSSTMPQKANPVLGETLVALGRQTSAQLGAMTGALVHVEERDASAWASEWTALPQMLMATGAGLGHARTLAGSLRPDAARMARAIGTGGGAIHAEALAFALAREIPLGDAQAMVKQAARTTAAEGGTLHGHLEPLCRARGIALPQVDETPAVETAAAFIARLRETFPA